MALDQMLPNSKKQQQLEAGKKRLEEFRKKKAAAKKTASDNSAQSANGSLRETKPPVSDTVQAITDATSDPILQFNVAKNEEPDVNPITSFSKPSASPAPTNLTHEADPEENLYKNSNQFSDTRLEDALKSSKADNLKDSSFGNLVTTRVSIQTPVSLAGDMNHFEHVASDSSSYFRSTEPISTSFRSEAVSLNNQTSMSAGLAGRRTRPSFLDSINVSGNADTDKPNPFSSKVHPVDSQNIMNSSGVSELYTEKRNYYNFTKQNEDFSALEQHIEDLTQEKFSLQRALDASRVLAESLATENSALTDSYNQQGGVVSQLKADMERLQDEINAQLVELEAVRTEYRNAQLECSAADERAKLLASEVIGLEEKVLRLRSNELKLERQLENLEAEITSNKRKISSLEKDRQDLQSAIDALQEEKKLMQSKLRNAPVTVGVKKSRTAKKEASTSTYDLDESGDTLATTTNPNFVLEVSSSSIPLDQLRMIQNIYTLISELNWKKKSW